MSRRAVALVIVALAAIVVLAAPAGAVVAEVPDGVNSILGPGPGEGVEPEDAGDRGGALQVATFVLIVGGLGLIGALIARDVRKGRDRRAAREGG